MTNALTVRLFIDFWNFQLNWNQRFGKVQCDWTKLPKVLLAEAQRFLSDSDLGTASIHETRVYASYESGRHARLKGWASSFLDKQPGFKVIIRERHWRQKGYHCRECDTQHDFCPSCAKPLGQASEKMIDSMIVTDMLSLAWDGAYDIGILLTSDADMVPAVECIQRRNLKIINATWKGHGHQLATAAWASFQLDKVIDQLKRPTT